MALHISPEEVGTAEFAMERQRHYLREHQAQVKRAADEAYAKMQAILEADETWKREKRVSYARRMSEMMRAKAREKIEKERAARNMGEPLVVAKPKEGPSVHDVICLVASSFEVQVQEILSRSKVATVAWPRQIVMYICMERLRRTSTQIANVLKRDHSTVLHARDKVKGMVLEDPDLRQRISEIEVMLS